MKYEEPKCSCGGKLYIYQESAIAIETKINKDGTRSKTPKKRELGESTSNWERLQCENCPLEWDFEEDSKGRILRGEDWWASNK